MVAIIITSIISATLLAITILEDVRHYQAKREFEKTLEESAKRLQERLTHLQKDKNRKK